MKKSFRIRLNSAGFLSSVGMLVWPVSNCSVIIVRGTHKPFRLDFLPGFVCYNFVSSSDEYLCRNVVSNIILNVPRFIKIYLLFDLFTFGKFIIYLFFIILRRKDSVTAIVFQYQLCIPVLNIYNLFSVWVI